MKHKHFPDFPSLENPSDDKFQQWNVFNTYAFLSQCPRWKLDHRFYPHLKMKRINNLINFFINLYAKKNHPADFSIDRYHLTHLHRRLWNSRRQPLMMLHCPGLCLQNEKQLEQEGRIESNNSSTIPHVIQLVNTGRKGEGGVAPLPPPPAQWWSKDLLFPFKTRNPSITRLEIEDLTRDEKREIQL